MRWHERRRSYRVSTPGAEAICEAGGMGDRYELEDLSLGGARLRGGRQIDPGARVQLTLFSGTFGTLAINGRVVREGRDNDIGMREVGISFGELEPRLEETLDDLLTDMIIEDFCRRGVPTMAGAHPEQP